MLGHACPWRRASSPQPPTALEPGMCLGPKSPLIVFCSPKASASPSPPLLPTPLNFYPSFKPPSPQSQPQLPPRAPLAFMSPSCKGLHCVWASRALGFDRGCSLASPTLQDSTPKRGSYCHGISSLCAAYSAKPTGAEVLSARCVRAPPPPGHRPVSDLECGKTEGPFCMCSSPAPEGRENQITIWPDSLANLPSAPASPPGPGETDRGWVLSLLALSSLR